MEEHGYTFLIFMSSISVIRALPSFYSEIYNGYTLVMPLTEGDRKIPLTLNSSFAKQWCSRNGAILPRIIDESDQKNIVQFIRSATRKFQFTGMENIFVNNINYTLYDNWTWVNGQPNQGFTVKQVGKGADGYFFGYLWTGDYRISESRPFEPRRCICEASATLRNSSICAMKLENRCYWKKDVSLPWYKARKACSKEGGDLSSFEKLNERILKVALKDIGLIEGAAYWVGIHKGVWRWNGKAAADSEIKYSNWKANHPSNYSAKCLCLNKQHTNDYEWIECDCDKSYPFICKRNGTFDLSTAIYTSKVSTVGISTTSTRIRTPPKVSTVGITTMSTRIMPTSKLSTVNIRPTTTSTQIRPTSKVSTVCITTRSTQITPTSKVSTVDITTTSTLSPQPMNGVTNASAFSGSVVHILLVISCFVIIIVLVILIVVAFILRKQRNRLVNSTREVPSSAKTTEAAGTNEPAIYEEIEEIGERKANKPSPNCSTSHAIGLYTAVRYAQKTRKEKPPKEIVYAELDILSTA